MIEVKDNFKDGLDLDNSLLKVSKASYVDALNITRVSDGANQDTSILNIVGNQLVNHTLHAGTNKVIGAYACDARNTIIYFVWNSNDFHAILEYNHTTRTITKIFLNLVDSATDILGFTEDDKITQINVYVRENGEGDLLFFLDSLNRPTYMDIALFKTDEYNPVTRDIIDVGKIPPPSPPTCNYSNDTSRLSNNLRNRLFRFKQRFVFDDLSKSTCSPISSIPLPLNILSDVYSNVNTNNNVIQLSLNSGDKNVKSIELLMSYVERTNTWSDFALVDAIDKTTVGLSETHVFYPSTSTGVGITFAGLVSVGTVVEIYLTLIVGSVPTLVGTYTTVSGDTISDITSGLASSILGIGIGGSTLTYGNAVYFTFDTSVYTFDEVIITVVNPDNDNVFFPYSFYNDSTYPLISITESIELFDTVPDKAESQDMPNGNTLVYGSITEGYDRELEANVTIMVNTIAAGSGGTTGNLVGVNDLFFIGTSSNEYAIYFDGIPAVGTVVEIKFKRVSDNVIVTVATYTTVSGDTVSSVVNGLIASMRALGLTLDIFSIRPASFHYVVSFSYEFSSLTITAPAVTAASNSIPTFPFLTERQLGLVYFDKKGKTNGVLYNSKVSFPAYAENGSQQVLIPYINAKIYHIPPDWAHYYQWVMTKENTWFIYWHTVNVNTTESSYLYFNVSNFKLNATKFPTTEQVLSYSFSDGDRLRLIRNMSTNTVYSGYDAAIEGLVTDPVINGVTNLGSFIKIKRVSPFNSVDYSTSFFVIQLYRPSQQLANIANKVYYEFAQQYAVGDPELSTRYHFGQVTNQDRVANVPAEFNFYNGDAYFRLRSIVLSESGVASFNVQDRNFVDFYISAVNDIDGRPNIIDVDAKLATFKAMSRFSQAYQSSTNINGLNRFYPNNYHECDITFGGIKSYSVRDRFMRVFQEFKIGSIPIFSEINKDASGNEIRVETDKLLNPVQYYAGNYGIGNSPESLASFNFADYFCDTNQGIICRVSNDGVTPISQIYRVNSFATVQLPLRNGTYKIYGVLEPSKFGNYIMALEATDDEPAYTLSFTEESNSFESPLSYHPEMMVSLPTVLITFKDGQLYTHDSATYNNFYGVQYDSYIDPVFNANPLQKKQPISITVVGNKKWDSPVIETSSPSYGTTKQLSNLVEAEFTELEGEFETSFKRDTNSRGGKINGGFLKGQFIKQRFRATTPASLSVLTIVSLKWNESPLNNR